MKLGDDAAWIFEERRTMKVGDLIAHLQCFDPDIEVCARVDGLRFLSREACERLSGLIIESCFEYRFVTDSARRPVDEVDLFDVWEFSPGVALDADYYIALRGRLEAGVREWRQRRQQLERYPPQKLTKKKPRRKPGL